MKLNMFLYCRENGIIRQLGRWKDFEALHKYLNAEKGETEELSIGVLRELRDVFEQIVSLLDACEKQNDIKRLLPTQKVNRAYEKNIKQGIKFLDEAIETAKRGISVYYVAS